MIISMLNQKGGVGKTTLSVNLSRYFTKKGIKTLLIDSDPQQSALTWHERSSGSLLDVACIPKDTLERDIEMFKSVYDLIFIDGPARLHNQTMAALKCADIILIPVTPSIYDIKATEDLARYAKDRVGIMNGKVKSAIVVSRVLAQSNYDDHARNLLLEFDLPIFNNFTGERISYVRSVDTGLSVLDGEYSGSKACKEIELIGQELEEFFK